MNDDIKALVESLRRGEYDDAEERVELLVAALLEAKADEAFLITLLRAPQATLRLAGLGAIARREEPSLRKMLLTLVEDEESEVRARVADILASLPAEFMHNPMMQLLHDRDGRVRAQAVKATSGNREFWEIQSRLLERDPDWNVRLAAAQAMGQLDPVRGLPFVLKALVTETDEDVAQACAEILNRALQEKKPGADAVIQGSTELTLKLEEKLKAWSQPLESLRAAVQLQTQMMANPAKLAEFGTNLTELAAAGKLSRGHGVEKMVATVVARLQAHPRRSLILLGPSGVGKTALVHEIVHAMAQSQHGRWVVLRMAPSEFMAGTKYMGEWETRVRELVQLIRAPKRVILYVPNIGELHSYGRWSKSDANIATALAPYLEDGSLLILGESTPQEFERTLGTATSVSRLFDLVRVPEAGLMESSAILQNIASETGLVLSAQLAEQFQETAEHYLGHVARPGNAAMVLRGLIEKGRSTGHELQFRDILEAFSHSTGIPAGLLDDTIPLREEDLRSHLESRIMGQPEAVQAMIDLILMIKAGVNDPAKPLGVYLFIGPTGVGKTELARAIAEYIFGDARRLLRLDMSEYASPSGFQRLIGDSTEQGLLTGPVKRQPFSVVLLDEIEKSHINIYDLCLQLFDAGRLTDGRGQVVDFRRSILILTSNIGAQVPSTPLGFKSADGMEAPQVDPDKTWRELSKFFRPEFLNRLDRIVHFRPLSLEVAERIARREIDMVLQRSGVARRQLTLDLDPSVVGWVVRRGYSPHFGARPLKRTVEQLILLPLAKTIAAGDTSPRTLISMSIKGEQLQISVQRPAKARPASPTPAESPKVIVPKSQMKRVQRARNLEGQVREIVVSIQPLRDRKSWLVEQASRPEFHTNAALRRATFDEIHRLDEFLILAEWLEVSVRNLTSRLDQSSHPQSADGSYESKLEDLEATAGQVGAIARARDALDLGEALIHISLVKRAGDPIRAVDRLKALYEGFAARKRFSLEVLGECYDDRVDELYVLVTGLGAFLLLKNESGLHEFNHRSNKTQGADKKRRVHEDLEMVRVDVFPWKTVSNLAVARDIRVELKPLRPHRSRHITKASWAVSAFHPGAVRAIEYWAAGTQSELKEIAGHLLQSVVQGGMVDTETLRVIRHYDLGQGSKIKDLRTGQSTSRLAEFFKGALELLKVNTEE